ncbi:hypothetical protein CVT25_012704 [Psilocybe cyanescens]|uniref:Uncharacterized protein n=1 Tax=Psilocybe cyanescens TaxID=93625 RepID=A0A409VN81_PSICY|nr:hypothetical protein CVT25_012704 [Psilocybe cyanescens]
MDVHEMFSHPEVEMMVKISGTPWKYEYMANETSLTVLELYSDNTTLIESMDKEAFAIYCGTRNCNLRLDHPDGPLLRVIFAEPLYLPPPSNFAIPPSRRNDNDNTALLLHYHFNVPMLFFRDQAPVATYLTIGNAMFVRRNSQGELDRLDGYYQYCSEKENRKPTHTWFSHSFEPKKKAANYIIHQCPKETMKLIRQCAEGSNPSILARPFAIDAFLLNHLIMEINTMVIEPRATLLSIERRVFTHEKVKNVSELHRVARDVRFIKDTVGALLETLDNVISAQKHHMSLVEMGHQVLDPDRESVRDSLSLLRSKANSIMREVTSLEGRASLKIDLEYNLENQQDSRTNLRIARLTTDIAAASQKDSSSMIT